MKTLTLILASAVALLGQTAQYVAISTQTGVTSDKLTLVQNANTPVYAEMVRAVVVSTVDGTVVVQRDGSAPTATATTIKRANGSAKFSALSAYAASNVGAGTAISVVYAVTANVPLVLDMTPSALGKSPSGQNISVVLATSGAADTQIALYWKETPQ